MNQLDVNVDDFVNAFKITGIVPVRNLFAFEHNEAKCGCALTALAVMVGASFEEIRDADFQILSIAHWLEGELHMHPLFIRGVISGFDGRHSIAEYTDDDTPFAKGHYVGKEVWNRIKDQAITLYP